MAIVPASSSGLWSYASWFHLHGWHFEIFWVETDVTFEACSKCTLEKGAGECRASSLLVLGAPGFTSGELQDSKGRLEKRAFTDTLSWLAPHPSSGERVEYCGLLKDSGVPCYTAFPYNEQAYRALNHCAGLAQTPQQQQQQCGEWQSGGNPWAASETGLI